MSLDEVRDAEAAVGASRRAAERVAALAEEIAAEQRVCQVLRERVRDEEADVDALEGASIRSVLARIRGNQNELLDRERAELAAVELELATHRAAVQQLRPEFEAQRELATRLADAEGRLAAALERRAEQLAGDPARAAALAEVDGRLAAERDAHDEFRAAHLAALGALGAVERAIEPIASAHGLSTLDVFEDLDGDSTGGHLLSAAKHGELDASVERIAEVHAALLNLRPHQQLIVTEVSRPNLVLPSARAAMIDTWFDNVFTDLSVHRRISGSLHDLRRTEGNLRELVDELGTYERIAGERLSAVEAERDALLRS